MLGDVIGYVTVKQTIGKRTLYPFGPMKDIQGKRQKAYEECARIAEGAKGWNGAASTIAAAIRAAMEAETK